MSECVFVVHSKTASILVYYWNIHLELAILHRKKTYHIEISIDTLTLDSNKSQDNNDDEDVSDGLIYPNKQSSCAWQRWKWSKWYVICGE